MVPGMSDEIKHIMLPGSEPYWAAYNDGEEYERQFPGQGGYDFAMCLEYADALSELPNAGRITRLEMLEEGMNDESDWIWYVTVETTDTNGLEADRRYVIVGWCDYTGWDCQSGCSVTDVT